jgi:bifunctional ADP-heptose synthase (sugar kinase/adenylyltransferase)
MSSMLDDAGLERILERLPGLTIGVVGDLFLDRYLDIDAALSEPSLETGLEAYQVVRVRSYPGAAGTVINNLAALGIGRICVVSRIGDDGEGYELRQALAALGVVDASWVRTTPGRRTPTYTKPMLQEAGKPPRELNRLDIKNRSRLPAGDEETVLRDLAQVWPMVHAIVVLDQVSEVDCGVVTKRVRVWLAEHGSEDASRLVLADSREQIGQFRGVALKPNRAECVHAVSPGAGPEAVERSALELARRAGRPVFCTCGAEGILVARPEVGQLARVPAYPVSGPIDPVGAGDSTSAALVSAVAAGATLEEAAAFGCLVASITIAQLGTTGTASPAQVRQRWALVRRPREASP